MSNWYRGFAACAAVIGGLLAPAAANAAIAMSSPRANSLYINSVPVSWATTNPPSSIAMIWTCTAGPCLQSISAPLTLDLVSTARSGSFSYNPSAATQTVFSNWPGPLPDGTWSVSMRYTVAGGVQISSATVSGVQVSTATAPPILTTPQGSTTTNLAAIPVQYTLPSAPSAGSDPSLTFVNASTSATSVLSLSPSVTSASFTLDPANLAASASVLAVTGPDSLTDGTYTVTLSYADSFGHAPASTTNSGWTLDRSTMTPSLSAPVNGATETTAFPVTFDLPEAALSGSVKLLFTGGPTPITVTLANVLPGPVTVLVDPAALAAGSDVMSASAATLPPGGYTLEVSYQDALGNPAGTSNPARLTVAAPAPVASTPGAPPTGPAAGGGGAPPPPALPPSAAPPAALPAAPGQLAGPRLGPITLGMPRTDVRQSLSDPTLTHNGFDRFRLSGGAIRVGYPSRRLLSDLSARQRAALHGRAILILTAVPSYHVHHLAPGAALSAAGSLTRGAVRVRIGLNTWYVRRQAHRTVILKVAHGTVCEIGIAARALTRGRRADRRLLTSFGA